ncbi:hypothetical protein J8J27_32975, partial [Mycobacterium tuberculosis]|nr:hypothetical protein [Mycobacterium tuberculosis]
HRQPVGVIRWVPPSHAPRGLVVSGNVSIYRRIPAERRRRTLPRQRLDSMTRTTARARLADRAPAGRGVRRS